MAKTSIIKQTRDVLQPAAKEAYDHWKEPPEGQVPVGDSGWYTSPNLQNDKGVSPNNCTEWPDSPYCGGNPWSRTPVGFELDYGVDKCGVWVEATPILGFTKLPPVSAGYRQPGECREEKKPPPRPPLPEDESRPVNPLNIPDTIPRDVDLFIVLVRKYSYEQRVERYPKDFWGQDLPDYNSISIDIQALNDSIYPAGHLLVDSYFPERGGTGQPVPVKALGIGKVLQQGTNKINFYRYDNSTNPPTPVADTRLLNSSKIYTGWIAADQQPPSVPNYKRYLSRELKGNYLIINCQDANGYLNQGYINPIASVVVFGTINEFARDWDNYVIDRSYSWVPDPVMGGTSGFYVYKEEWEIAYVSIPDKKKQPPPPDAERKRKCCMQCCNEGSQRQNKQDRDNAEILRLLRKLDKNIGGFPFKAEIFDADNEKVGIQKRTINITSLAHANALEIGEAQRTLKAIGIDHFPIYSPSSVIDDESNGLLGDLGDLKNKIFKQKIESLAEFLVWRAKNDNEIFGQWQEVIEIQDSDPNVKGNQPKRVVLPNMAKSFKEIILLLSLLIKSQGFSMDAILKMYIDLANTKVSASVSEAILRDIQDYLDYPTNTTTLDVPMGISIPKDNDPTDDKEDVERFLRNSTIKAMFDDWNGEGSLHDMMLTLLDAAARTIQKPHT